MSEDYLLTFPSKQRSFNRTCTFPYRVPCIFQGVLFQEASGCLFPSALFQGVRSLPCSQQNASRMFFLLSGLPLSFHCLSYTYQIIDGISKKKIRVVQGLDHVRFQSFELAAAYARTCLVYLVLCNRGEV